MKKGYVCKCSKCGFMTNEKNKVCPLCGKEMVEVEHEQIQVNPNLPDILDNNKDRDVKMGYYCFKHQTKMRTKVCINCNDVGSLYVEYNNKTAIIKRINSLTDKFTDEEIEVILQQLTEEEKMYIYYNYESAYRFFYKKDKPKAIVCFIFSFVFYFLFLDMVFNMNERNFDFVGYIFNMIGNILFVVLNILGVWYLCDATNVEFKKIPIKVGVCVLIPNLIQLAYTIIRDTKVMETLISGYVTMGVSVLVYVLYFLWEKKHEK